MRRGRHRLYIYLLSDCMHRYDIFVEHILCFETLRFYYCITNAEYILSLPSILLDQKIESGNF